VQQQLGACTGGATGTQIQGFITNCTGSTGSQALCTTWQQAAAANVTCLGCIIGAGDGTTGTSAGAEVLDYSMMYYFPNTPGCLALTNPSGGAACAAALSPSWQCEQVACGSAACQAATSAEFTACVTAADATGGACATQSAAVTANCAGPLDGGAADTTCAESNFAGIINVICGTGQ